MRIALVNDQVLALEALSRALALRPEHRVIWTARNGAEALEYCARDRPDLILMDLLMPVMDGVEATRRIMAQTPCGILIVTASVGANSWRVFEAMGHGALDAVDTPTGAITPASPGAAALLAKIGLLAQRIRDGSLPGLEDGRRSVPTARGADTLIAIGASAGGPAALAAVLQQLPASFPAALVIVQHVDLQFAPGMAEWLNRVSALNVRVARQGDAPAPGAVLLAGTNDHLAMISATEVGYTPEPRDNVYRPSIDVFFQSVAMRWRGGVIGVLLTGMGRDGALGLKALRNHGHVTLAQDQATCAVYGIPKAAAHIGAATEVLALPQIAPRLVELVARR